MQGKFSVPVFLTKKGNCVTVQLTFVALYAEMPCFIFHCSEGIYIVTLHNYITGRQQ